jgi:hypothetical protein
MTESYVPDEFIAESLVPAVLEPLVLTLPLSGKQIILARIGDLTRWEMVRVSELLLRRDKCREALLMFLVNRADETADFSDDEKLKVVMLHKAQEEVEEGIESGLLLTMLESRCKGQLHATGCKSWVEVVDQLAVKDLKSLFNFARTETGLEALEPEAEESKK